MEIIGKKVKLKKKQKEKKGKLGFSKKRIIKKDGRYLIYYSWGKNGDSRNKI